LYLVAAGIFSRAVWYFEANKWAVTIGGDALGSGPGSYDIRNSVWHVNVRHSLLIRSPSAPTVPLTTFRSLVLQS
jgi:high-affinity Fe2+/Pb2+ permease